MADELGTVRTEVDARLAKIRVTDSNLYDVISLLNQQVDAISQQLSPLIAVSRLAGAGVPVVLGPVLGFLAVSTGKTVRFKWSAVTDATQYEIRLGTVWETAFFVTRTSQLQADIDPLVYGTYTYLIKSLDSGGNYSSAFSSTVFIVSQIPAPVITSQIIDNNVLLNWSLEPHGVFDIDHYVIYKNGVSVGVIFATFAILFEVVSGSYTYSIRGVDIVGNVGDSGSVTVSVSQPPDFVLQDVRTSLLNGTRVNAYRQMVLTTPTLIVCVPTCGA